MAIAKLEGAAKLFAGQGDLIMFAAVPDYDAETLDELSDFTTPQSLGQIVQDSTTWEGEDVSTDEILDEQGNIITAHVTAGTLSFSFDIASTSQLMVQTFLGGDSIASPGTFAGLEGTGTLTATGFGVKLPVITRPIAIINDELNRAWFYPKAKITANLAYSDGLYRIHAVVVAEQVDKTKIKTAMVIDRAPAA